MHPAISLPGSKLSLRLFLSALFCTAVPAAPYQEAPQLAARVAAGELPPVEERLPEEPLVVGRDL